MNALPVELSFKILGYLPRIDLRHFQQLNSSVRHIATTILKDCKPTYGMAIGDYYKEFYFINLETRSSTIELFFDGTGRLKSSSQSETFFRLKEDFEAFVEQHLDAPHAKDVFLTWLFSKIDLRYIKIKAGGRYQQIAKDILQALRVQPFRCNLLVSLDEISYRLGFGANSLFIKEFCELQRQQGVNVYLQLVPPNAGVDGLNDIDILNSYPDFFDVLLVDDNTGVFPSMVAFVKRWHQRKQGGHLAEFQAANFRIRFDYNSLFEHSSVTLADDFWHLQETIFALECITEEEIFCMEGFETSCLPEEIVCRHLDDGTALSFKFDRRSEFADMTVEIERLP